MFLGTTGVFSLHNRHTTDVRQVHASSVEHPTFDCVSSSLCAHDFFLFQRVSQQTSMKIDEQSGILNPVWPIEIQRRRDDITCDHGLSRN